MTKKNKSIERVRNNTTVMNDSNLNNQQVQIIFPPDTEIRKVKKKPKKKPGKSKSEKEKDELLEQLKENLKQYDLVQEEAAQKKIKIPQELAVSTITKSDLKKNDDIKLFISDVVNKTQKIKELIAEAEKNLNQLRRGFPVRLGSGIMQFPRQPALFPSPQQPQIIPQQPIMPSQSPLKIPTTPSSDEDEKAEALKKIAEETKEELEKEGVDVPIKPPSDPNTSTNETPISPGSLLPKGDAPIVRPPQVPPINIPTQSEAPDEPKPSTPITVPAVDTSNYESNTLRNGQTVKTPPGWYDLYFRLQNIIKNLEQRTVKISDGVYNIPLNVYNEIKAAQKQLQTDYDAYFDSLKSQDKAYILKEPMVKAVHEEMKTDFRKDPKDLLIQLLKEQNINIKEVSAGNEKPQIVKDIDERGLKDDKKQKSIELYKQKLQKETKYIQTNIGKKLFTLNLKQLTNALKEINSIEEEIKVEYDKLDPVVQLDVREPRDELLEKTAKLKRAIDNRALDDKKVTDDDVPKLERYIESGNYTPQGFNSVYASTSRLFGRQTANEIGSISNSRQRKKRVQDELQKYLQAQAVAGPPLQPVAASSPSPEKNTR